MRYPYRVRAAVLLLAIWGCNGDAHGPYLVGHDVCVEQAATVGDAPGADALGCKDVPYELVKPTVSGLCGPCRFALNRAMTPDRTCSATDHVLLNRLAAATTAAIAVAPAAVISAATS